MSTSGRNCTSSVICPVPSHVGQRSEPVLYENAPAVRPRAFAASVRANNRRRSSSTPLYVATVERTFAPIGVASIIVTRSMPGASNARTCSGIRSSAIFAVSAGTRLSSTSVVLPDPETPVTTVRRCFGTRASNACTVCRCFGTRASNACTVCNGAVLISIAPSLNTASAGVCGRTICACSLARNGAMSECGLRSTGARSARAHSRGTAR